MDTRNTTDEEREAENQQLQQEERAEIKARIDEATASLVQFQGESRREAIINHASLDIVEEEFADSQGWLA